MRDAVVLEGQTIIIDSVDHIIHSFYFVPGTNYLYVKLITPEKNTVNYTFEKLLPFLIEQIKL